MDTYINPYQKFNYEGYQKANFHTHAGTGAGTCGANPLDKVIDIYKGLGYNFLCISNHDIFTDTSSFTDDKICLVPGVEYSKDRHVLNIGVNRSLHEYDTQTAIDMTNDMGGFSVICHPNWFNTGYWSEECLDKLSGYIGIEIINMLIYKLSGSGRATDKWDHLLSSGRLIFGFGNDDFHSYTDAARSFNLINSPIRNYESMKTAIDNGAFCVSTGVYPEYLLLENNIIKVKAKFPMESYINEFTYRFIKENGEVALEYKGVEAKYELNNEKYVRVEVIGENGAMLFFQPVYRKDAFERV